MTTEDELRELEAKISKGFKMAFENMLEFKKYKGTPVVVSRNGKVVKIPPEEFLSKIE